MKLDDLKTIWKQEVNMQTHAIDFDSIRTKVDEYDRRARVSWGLELLACAAIVVAVGIGWFLTDKPSPLFQLGMAAMIVSAVFIAGKIALDRRVSGVDNWTLAGKINIQIEKREKEARLLNSVALWYLNPLFIAVVLASYGGYNQRTGSYIPDTGLWIYWAVCAVIYVGIYFYNHHHARVRIQPLLNQLRALKRELEE